MLLSHSPGGVAFDFPSSKKGDNVFRIPKRNARSIFHLTNLYRVPLGAGLSAGEKGSAV